MTTRGNINTWLEPSKSFIVRSCEVPDYRMDDNDETCKITIGHKT